MKRMKHILMTFLFAGMLCLLSMAVHGKELEVCRLCNGYGNYQCVWCNNTGEVLCDGCGGIGGSKCEGDTFKGNSCDSGYYTCGSCNGDGKKRNGDGEIVEGACGNCNGAGRLRCIACSNGPQGVDVCTRCDGDGITLCQSCIPAREKGYKCPKCTGTGYVLVGNPMPPAEDNDGRKNAPQEGDHIMVDGGWNYYVYGQDSKALFSYEKVPLTVQPEQQSEESVPASTQTGKVQTSEECQNDEEQKVNPPYYEILPSGLEEAGPNVIAIVETSKMSGEEQEYYASLEEGELDRKLTNVQKIIASVQIGRFEENTEELIYCIANQNGYSTLSEGRILPIYFEGHEDLGFPIEVRVDLERGVLNGGKDLYIYHICRDQTIESLGKANYYTYDDGSVECISFFTTGFSTFFSAADELNLTIDRTKNEGGILHVSEDSEYGSVADSEVSVFGDDVVERKSHRIAWITVIIVSMLLVGAVVVGKRYLGKNM